MEHREPPAVKRPLVALRSKRSAARSEQARAPWTSWRSDLTDLVRVRGSERVQHVPNDPAPLRLPAPNARGGYRFASLHREATAHCDQRSGAPVFVTWVSPLPFGFIVYRSRLPGEGERENRIFVPSGEKLGAKLKTWVTVVAQRSLTAACDVRTRERGLVVIDLSSHNGTFVNGERVSALSKKRKHRAFSFRDRCFRRTQPLSSSGDPCEGTFAATAMP
jgi:hypothetical protein